MEFFVTIKIGNDIANPTSRNTVVKIIFFFNAFASQALDYQQFNYITNTNKNQGIALYINEIVLCTMKSEQARMKSSAFASDEMKSASYHPALAGFHRAAISSTKVDLFRRRRISLKKAQPQGLCFFICLRTTKRCVKWGKNDQKYTIYSP